MDMVSLGRFLALPVRLVNVPARAIEKFIDIATGDETPKEDCFVSGPLEALAEAIEEAVEGDS